EDLLRGVHEHRRRQVFPLGHGAHPSGAPAYSRRVTDLPDATLRYDDHPDGLLDVHLPPEPSDRLLFLFHGGFWTSEWDSTHTRPTARALADLGWVVAT